MLCGPTWARVLLSTAEEGILSIYSFGICPMLLILKQAACLFEEAGLNAGSNDGIQETGVIVVVGMSQHCLKSASNIYSQNDGRSHICCSRHLSAETGRCSLRDSWEHVASGRACRSLICMQ